MIFPDFKIALSYQEVKSLKRFLDSLVESDTHWLRPTRREDGYSTFGEKTNDWRGNDIYSHRLAARLWIGDPTGFEVDHLCRVRNCCNPEHLRIVPLELNRPGSHTKRARIYTTHCKRGHKRVLHENKYRQCKACMRDRWKRDHKPPTHPLEIFRSFL